MCVAALPPLGAAKTGSPPARDCACGAAPPFQVWPVVASAGAPASALLRLAAGALLPVGGACLLDAVALAPCAGVATLADRVAVLASSAAAAALVSCAAGTLLASAAATAPLASGVIEVSPLSWLDAIFLASTNGSAGLALALDEAPIAGSGVAAVAGGGVLMTALATMTAATGCAWLSVATVAAAAPVSVSLSLSDEVFFA